MPGEDDEPYFEQIGGGLIDDRVRRTPGRRGDWQDDDGGPRSNGRASLGAAYVLQTLRHNAVAFRSLPTWLGVAAAVAVPAALTYGLAAWAASERWIESELPVAAHVALAAFLVVSASVYGAVVGFRGIRPSGGRFAGAASYSAVRAAAFALAGGFLLAVVGLAAGGSPTTTVVGVVVMVLELLIFAALGAGAGALAGSGVAGAILAVALAALLLFGNIGATILLAPTVWTSERASLAVNVDRDGAGRLNYYECVGNQSRVEAVAHSERVAWITASHPAVLFSSLAAGTVPAGTEFGWMLQIPQWAMDGPAWDVACLNGVGSEELPPPLHVGLVGIAGQLGVATLVLAPASWLSRRRERRQEQGGAPATQ